MTSAPLAASASAVWSMSVLRTQRLKLITVSTGGAAAMADRSGATSGQIDTRFQPRATTASSARPRRRISSATTPSSAATAATCGAIAANIVTRGTIGQSDGTNVIATLPNTAAAS